MTVIKALKRNTLNVRYLLIFLFFLILVFSSLFQEFSENIGLSSFFVRTASEVSFLQNTLTRHYMTVLTIVGSLLTTIACSSIFTDDYEANMLGSIFTRTKIDKYHISNMIAVLISAFLLVFMPLLLGYLISLIACPATTAFDNMNAMPTYFISDYKSSMLELWKLYNPVLFTMFHIVLVSLIFSLCAGFGYAISMIVKWNRYIPISIVFAVYTVYNIGLTKFGLEKITFFNLIDPYAEKVTIGCIFLILLVYALIVLIMFMIGLKKNGDSNE